MFFIDLGALPPITFTLPMSLLWNCLLSHLLYLLYQLRRLATMLLASPPMSFLLATIDLVLSPLSPIFAVTFSTYSRICFCFGCFRQLLHHQTSSSVASVASSSVASMPSVLVTASSASASSSSSSHPCHPCRHVVVTFVVAVCHFCFKLCVIV